MVQLPGKQSGSSFKYIVVSIRYMNQQSYFKAYTQENENTCPIETAYKMLIAALSIVAKKSEKQLNVHQLMNEWKNVVKQHSDYYSAMGKKWSIGATTWINLKNIMLSGTSRQ